MDDEIHQWRVELDRLRALRLSWQQTIELQVTINGDPVSLTSHGVAQIIGVAFHDLDNRIMNARAQLRLLGVEVSNDR